MVLVPGTFGGGHQEENAAAMVAAGAAIRLADADLTGDGLVAALESLDGARLRDMAAASAKVGRRDAAQRVLAVLHEVVGR
jgi:UDP-N-acetylglucosamine--N-acetylmuramyl-(pentapeptide) pyrophosphoryl-undecaprenol N-acetylglucosamine transferase